MTLSTVIRDLFKAIHAFLSLRPPQPSLPDSLADSIESFLDKYTEYDPATSDRLHDELLAVFTKSVHGQSYAHYASFLAVLSRLRPALRSPVHVAQWWDKAVDPVLSRLDRLDRLGPEKASLTAVLGDVDRFLVQDDEGPEAEGAGSHDGAGASQTPVSVRLLQKWMDAYHDPPPEDAGSFRGWATEQQPLHQVVIRFGRQKPMDFFNALHSFFIRRDYRAQSLTLLTDFVRSQPPHIHLAIKSRLFDSLLHCLLHDTSTTVVSLALTAITMLLPNMPSSIVPVLPPLFNIYARMLFWDREPPSLDERLCPQASQGHATQESPALGATGSSWDKCTFAADKDCDTIPHKQLLSYYTMLYGLYPLNFMDYIRKPQRYLRHADVTGADDVEVQPSEIRDRSEQFRQCHLLHPNFFSLTIESERTDFGRWMKSATADVVAECVALHVPASREPDAARHDVSSDYRASSPLSSGHGRHSALLRRDSQSPSPTPSDADSSASPTRPPSEDEKDVKEPTLASVPSRSLSQQPTLAATEPIATSATSAASAASGTVAATGDDTVAQMRRRMLLLQNDLDFERYMVQQHLAHIGTLRRSNMKQVVTEAETQNLILVNRTLKKRLEEAKKTEAQVKKEAEISRNRYRNWEETLSSRLKKLVEKQKAWTAEETELRTSLRNAQDECTRLVAIVCEKEVRELKLEQDMTVLAAGQAERDRLHERVKTLGAVEQENSQLREQVEKAAEELEKADNMLELLQMKMEARETEFRQTQDYYQQQVAQLTTQVNTLLRDGRNSGLGLGSGAGAGSGASLAETRATVESALTASRLKNLELQKNQARLARKVRVLESQLLDQQARVDGEPEADRSGGGGGGGGVNDDSTSLAFTDTQTEAGSYGRHLMGGISMGLVGGGGGGSSSMHSHRHMGHRAVSSEGGSGEGISPPQDTILSMSASLGSIGAPAGGSTSTGSMRRPLTPPGSAGDDRGEGGGGAEKNGTAGGSPQADRYHGRGGAQNTSMHRKERKKKEEDKKEKRSAGSGMRSIRGFV